MSKSVSLRGRLAVGTALAGVMLTGYGRAIAGTCVQVANPIVCAGPASLATDTTQTLNFTTTITQANTMPGFGMNTASGDAIDLNGSGSFSDPNMSSITGAYAGIAGNNGGTGALSITTTGAVKGNSGQGLYGYNAPTATDLTINAGSATGQLQGISARNYGTGALSITATGAVVGTTKAGIFAYNKVGTTLTINAAAVSGGNSGINALTGGSGLLSITTTGAVSGAGAGSPGMGGAYRTGSGIYAYSGGTGGVTVHASGPVTETGAGSVGIGVEANSTVTGDVNITATDTTGANHGIFVQNYGSGSLSVTSTGTATGMTKSGIAAYSASALTINANTVNGGGSGIYAHTGGAGALSITTTGAVTSTGSGSPASGSGIYAKGTGTGAIGVTANGAISATGGTSYGVFVKNAPGATGPISVTTAAVSAGVNGINVYNQGSGSTTVTATGAVTTSQVAGTGAEGVKVVNAATATDLTINAASVSGQTYGVSALNNGTGALTVVTSGAITSATGPGIQAINTTASTGDLKVTAATVYGAAIGIAAYNRGTGSLSITATGDVSASGENLTSGASSPLFAGRQGYGVVAINGASGNNLTVNVSTVDAREPIANIDSGIYVNNKGVGSTTVTSSGVVLGETLVETATTSTGPVIINIANAGQSPSAGVGGQSDNATGITLYSRGSGSASVTVGNAFGYKAGVYAGAHGAGLSVTITGAAVGEEAAFTGAGLWAYNVGTAPTTILITQSGSAMGVHEGILTSGPQPVTITNQGAIANLSGVATDQAILATTSAVTLDNSGTITGLVTLGTFANTVNLTGGAVDGTIDTGNGSSTLNFTGGTLTGAVNFGSGGGNAANLTNLTSANLSGATHIDGGSGAGNVLTLSNVLYQGGSYDADNTALGVNLLAGWTTMNFDNGTRFTLTGSLTTSAVNIDPSSTLFVGNGVDPMLAATTGSVAFANAGTLDLTNGGVVGSSLTINGTYAQASTGTLVIGVSPTAIDLLTATGTATLAGTVDLAFAPGTYTAGTRSFLTSAGLSGTFNAIQTTAAPSGFTPTVGYTTTDAQLILTANAMMGPKCVLGGTSYLCSGSADLATDTTQTLTYSGAVTSGTTAPGFGMNTATGDAIDINVTNGGGSFTDANASSITGAASGVVIANTGTGAFTFSSNGVITGGSSGSGVKATNAATATNLTVNVNTVTGQQYGVYASNAGSGAVTVTATGAVTGRNNIALYAQT